MVTVKTPKMRMVRIRFMPSCLYASEAQVRVYSSWRYEIIAHYCFLYNMMALLKITLTNLNSLTPPHVTRYASCDKLFLVFPHSFGILVRLLTCILLSSSLAFYLAGTFIIQPAETMWPSLLLNAACHCEISNTPLLWRVMTLAIIRPPGTICKSLVEHSPMRQQCYKWCA